VKPAVLTPHVLRQAEAHLVAADPVLARIVQQVGRCGLHRSRRLDPFTALVEAIVWQQLSTRAAATIYKRLLALFPDGHYPTPAAIKACSDESMRAAGLSRAKTIYLRDLATKVANGTVILESIHTLPDDDVVEATTQVKGIGRWSAEMFLMFRLLRPDVMPVGDLGIVNAIKRQYRLRKTPTPARILRIAAPWRPYRSVACWYLWASLDAAPGGAAAAAAAADVAAPKR
jgi:DNA-3-methyladenine glycosylase II